MAAPFTQLYLHVVWATWDRMPLLVPKVERAVYATVLAKCRELGADPVAIGGLADHIHLLVRLPTTLAVADLVKEVKGGSSHLVTHEVVPSEFFKWQGSYGAFSVSKEVVPQVTAYIERQKEHHRGSGVVTDWERTTLEPQPT
jgi:REP-associated tyrosine transposase